MLPLAMEAPSTSSLSCGVLDPDPRMHARSRRRSAGLSAMSGAARPWSSSTAVRFASQAWRSDIARSPVDGTLLAVLGVGKSPKRWQSACGDGCAAAKASRVFVQSVF